MGRRGNNEGSISKRPDGRWMARVSMPDGTRATVYGETRAKAKAKMDELFRLAEQRAHLLPGRSYATFGDFLETWVANVGPSVKPNTADFYAQYVRLYTGDLAAIPPEQLKAQHIQQVYAKMLKQGLSPTTVRHLHATLHRAFDSAVRQGVVLQNLCEQVDAPRIAQKEMLTFTVEQSRHFLESAKDRRYEALFVLAISTGMRQGELLGLTWENVDLARGLLYVKGNLQWLNSEALMQEPKTKHGRRRIYLGPLARQALTEHRARQQQEREAMAWGKQKWNLVFTNLKGGPLHPTTLVHQHYEPLLKAADLPRLRFHDLRHTAATHLLEAGINPKVVSEMLGHSSVSITLALYSHVTPSMSYSASMVLDKVLRGEINPLTLPEGLDDLEQ